MEYIIYIYMCHAFVQILFPSIILNCQDYKLCADVTCCQNAAWLFRRAQTYQEYMKSITIPTNRCTIFPYTTWTGLGSSIKQAYEQPLHYLTNIQLKRMDRERLGADDEHIPLDLIIHPYKAEATIWLIEEVHRRTSSPHHLAELWAADPMYHAFIDAIFPKLGS